MTEASANEREREEERGGGSEKKRMDPFNGMIRADEKNERPSESIVFPPWRQQQAFQA